MPDTNEHDVDARRWWETQQKTIVQGGVVVRRPASSPEP